MKTGIKYLKLLANIIYGVIVLLIIVYVLPKLITFFMPFVVGWIVSLIANPLVRLLEKRVKIVRRHSSMLIIILVLAAIIGTGYIAVTSIGGQLVRFIGDVPQIYKNISAEAKTFGENMQGFYERLPGGIQEALMILQASFGEEIGNIVSKIGAPTVTASVNFAKNIPAILIAIIFTVLSAYFFLAEREKIVEVGGKMIPDIIQEKWKLIFNSLKGVTGGYIKAQVKIMFIVALILFIGFLLLRVDYAILFAILIALLDALPFFGTGTALVPWAIVKFMGGDYQFALGLLIIYVVSQLVRQLIQPKIVGDSIGLSPLSSLILMYAGYKLYGVWGMIFSVPLGMIVINLYKSGLFDNIMNVGKTIIDDFNNFRKV